MLVWKCQGTVWRRRELQLADVEARPFGVAGAALDLVEVAGVLDRFESFGWSVMRKG